MTIINVIGTPTPEEIEKVPPPTPLLPHLTLWVTLVCRSRTPPPRRTSAPCPRGPNESSPPCSQMQARRHFPCSRCIRSPPPFSTPTSLATAS